MENCPASAGLFHGRMRSVRFPTAAVLEPPPADVRQVTLKLLHYYASPALRLRLQVAAVIGQEAAPGWSLRMTPKPGAEFQFALAAAAWNDSLVGEIVAPFRHPGSETTGHPFGTVLGCRDLDTDGSVPVLVVR
jgi:hypothetical protein